MLKKLLITYLLLTLSTGIVFAKTTPYAGVGIGIHNTGGYTGLMENAFAGMGKIVGGQQDYYLGGEIFAEFGSVPLSNNQANRAKYGLGISLIPGIILYQQDTMAYLRVGCEALRYPVFHSTDAVPQIGAGLQTKLYKNWDVRGEFLHSFGYGALDNLSRTKDNRLNVGFLY